MTSVSSQWPPSNPRKGPLKQRILHVSGDFPDDINPAKTHAISNLLGLVADEFIHEVVSLNRVAPSPREALALASGRGRLVKRVEHRGRITSVAYATFGKGMLHRTMLLRLADEMLELLDFNPLPDLVIGYKLTIEGFVVAELARALGVPYALVSQGHTDGRIMAVRPDLAPHLAELMQGAAVLFPLAPWTLAMLERRLGPSRASAVFLPCPLAFDDVTAPVVGGGRLVTAFHLGSHRRKNFARTADAARRAGQAAPGLHLNVIGGGDSTAVARVRSIAAGNEAVSLSGPLANGEVARAFNGARGFVLASLGESFGMVFIEALMSGCPIAYPAGRAVDGYFPDQPFAIAVDPRDSAAIADAMLRLYLDEARLKGALGQWQADGGLDRFRRRQIGEAFALGLRDALGRGREPEPGCSEPRRA